MGQRPRYETGRFKKRAHSVVVRAWQWGVLAIGAVFAADFFVGEISRIRSGVVDASGYLYLALLATVAVYITGWVLVTQYEIDLLDHWLDGAWVPNDFPRAVLVVGVGAGLAILVLAARNPLFFSTVFLAFTAVVAVGIRAGHDPILDAIAQDRAELDEDAKNPQLAERVEIFKGALATIVAFWDTPRHLRRQVLIGVLTLGALSLAATAHLNGSTWLRAASYAWLVGMLLGTEAQIYVWRYRRDAELRRFERERVEVERALARSGWDLEEPGRED